MKRNNNGTFGRQNLEGKIINGIKFVKYQEKTDKSGYSIYKTECSFCGRQSEMPSYRYTRKTARCICSEWKQIFSKPIGRPAAPEAASHIHRYYERYKKSALERNLAFELTIDDFTNIIEQNCVYCGAPPKERKIGETCSGTYKCNGIDRADNNAGYTRENSLPCCRDCNFCKGTLGRDDFINLVRKIYEHTFKGTQ